MCVCVRICGSARARACMCVCVCVCVCSRVCGWVPDVDKCSDGEGKTRSQLAVCEHAGGPTAASVWTIAI